PVIRQVTIPAACPRCGGPRGVARNLNQCDDGAYYSVDVWDNPCGHVDMYAAVVKESAEFARQQGGARWLHPASFYAPSVRIEATTAWLSTRSASRLPAMAS